jgi:hypothetical protein
MVIINYTTPDIATDPESAITINMAPIIRIFSLL